MYLHAWAPSIGSQFIWLKSFPPQNVVKKPLIPGCTFPYINYLFAISKVLIATFTLSTSIFYTESPNSVFGNSLPSESFRKKMNGNSFLTLKGLQNNKVGSLRLCLNLNRLILELLRFPAKMRLLAVWSCKSTSLITSENSSPSSRIKLSMLSLKVLQPTTLSYSGF